MLESLHVIIPFYNAETTLERTISSLNNIEAAHRARVKVLAVDDGSTDHGCEVFENSISAVAGIEYALIRKTNGGSGSARNEGLRQFSAGWTLFLDADDELILDPLPFLDRNPGRSALFFATEFYRDGKFLKKMKAFPLDAGSLPAVLTARNPFTIESVVFRRELLNSLFDEELRFLEDWHFWAVNPAVFADCAAFPQVALGRVHAGRANKSADLYNNGRFRIAAAQKISGLWGDRLGEQGRNNLRMQEAIGKIMMGEKGSLAPFTRFPVSPSLFGKYVIYSLFYSLYRRLQPYR